MKKYILFSLIFVAASISEFIYAQSISDITASFNNDAVIVEFDLSKENDDDELQTELTYSFDYGNTFFKGGTWNNNFKSGKTKLKWEVNKSYPEGLPSNDVVFKLKIKETVVENVDCTNKLCNNGLVTKQEDCTWCDGRGYFGRCETCSTCKGYGNNICKNCGGTGSYKPYNLPPLERCYECDGTGKTRCHNCTQMVGSGCIKGEKYVSVPCQKCSKGKVSVEKACRTCGGDGVETKTRATTATSTSETITLNPAKIYKNKIALVIGNSNYANCSTLPNAVNDASLMKSKLSNLGYTVYHKEDCSLAEFKAYLAAFSNDLNQNELGFFYYAGHACEDEVTGINYMVPTDAPAVTKSNMAATCFPLTKVTSALSNGENEAFVVVFDACRDVPGRSVTTKTVLNRGLNTVPSISNKSKEYLIIFSAGPGEVATDGDGQNSPFTKTLAEQLTPKNRLVVSDLFKKISLKVRETTKQHPMLVNSSTDFSL